MPRLARHDDVRTFYKMQRLETGYGPVEIQACTPGIFRVRLFGPPELPDASYIGERQWDGVPDARTTTHDDGTVEVTTARGAVLAQLDRSSRLSLAFHDADGPPVLAPPRDQRASRMASGDVSHGVGWGRTRLRLARTGVEEMHCYGLGQGGGGTELERLGTSRMLWNSHHGHG